MIENYDNQRRKRHPDIKGFLRSTYVACNGCMPPSEDNKGEPVEAFINHNRWLAKCPHDGCNSALFISKENPVFLCTNADCEDKCWHEIVFPKYHKAIEVVLDKRPNKANRNWKPGETLNELKKENADNGVE